ncbi:MAG: hypothetical protein CME55_06515 [Halieaceae bacterium]|nr:hypothetical protein [Halieaceae bacterium]
MMHTVPKTLRGASLGKAHQWVRSITDSREYALENPSGESISLGDLTNGTTTEVRIVGSVKQNPAHPATFTSRRFGANRHTTNLTHVLPEEVQPALVSAMVREHGLFGAVQSLSMLMARPLNAFTASSPMAEELLRARFYDYKGGALPLRNPTPPIGFGRSFGGRLLGEEVAETDAAMMKYVKEAMAPAANVQGLATQGEMKNFVDSAFTPYLLAAEANRRAIEYIRQHILPVAKELKIRGKALQREFDYMVKHMATDPADFYNGKDFSINAHPAFLFPGFGVVILPPPVDPKTLRKGDDAYFENEFMIARVNDLFMNAGNPPQYRGGTFVRRTDKNEKALRPPRRMRPIGPPPARPEKYAVDFLGDYMLGGSQRGGDFNWDFIKERAKKLDIGAIVGAFDDLAKAGLVDATDAPLADDAGAYVEAYQTLTSKQQADILQRGQAKFPPVVWVMDLVGMRPRPTDWPDSLVLAAMQVVAKYRTNVGANATLDFNFNTNVSGPETVTVPVGGPGAGVPPITITIADLDKPDLVPGGKIETDIAAAMAPIVAAAGAGGGAVPPSPYEVYTAAIQQRLGNLKFNNLMMGGTNPVSMGDVMLEAVSLAITKYGYESSAEDIRFVTALMVASLPEIQNASGTVSVTNLARQLAQVAQTQGARNRGTVTRAINRLTAPPAAGAPALTAVQRLMALQALQTALQNLGGP